MKLIVGLGNPGKKYENTRHNVGFLVLDKIMKDELGSAKWGKSKGVQLLYHWTKIASYKIELIKPQTFMNNSGQAVIYAVKKHDLSPQDIWVICDDIDLELGQIRIRVEGSSGGHKGLQSIINQIGDNRFVRFRVGIGSNNLNIEDQSPKTRIRIPAEDYVLKTFPQSEMKIISNAVDKCAELIIESLDKGIIEETIDIRK